MRKSLLLVLCVFTLASCEKDFDETSKNFTDINSKYQVKNGRLYFPSKAVLREFFARYSESSDSDLESIFNPLYEEGFYSLRPIVTENNENLVYNNYIKLIRPDVIPKSSKSNSEEEYFDYLDEIEEIIGDDVFAAMLNQNGEIQIADEIYKYTDVGLFFSKVDKYDVLKSYLENKNISEDLKIETSETVKTEIKDEFPNSGTTIVNSEVSYFKILYNSEPTVLDPNEGSSPTGGGYTPTPSAPSSSDPSYLSFLNNLQYCAPETGFWNTISNWFGDNNVCIDRYESRRRVKTKAYNYDYLIVYHLGIKCKHQYKGFTGLWRAEAADEIRLVLEAGQFEYDLDELLGNNAINNQIGERNYFMNNQKAFFIGPNSFSLLNEWGSPVVSYYNLTSLPPAFQDNLTFEFFGTGWDLLDNSIQDGIDSNLDASRLNNYFYNQLYQTITSQLHTAFGNSTTPPNSRTFVAKFPQSGKLLVQKSHLSIGYGNAIAQKTFDWGVEINFSASSVGGGSWNISGGQGTVLVRPENFRVKMIGAVRTGSGWHGSKMSIGID